MKKAKNIYSWFRTLSAVLLTCFLMVNTTIAQSNTNQPIAPDKVSVQESSDIQGFIDWWTFIFRYYKIKITTTDTSVEGGDSTNNHKKIRTKVGITTTDMSVREPRDD